MTAKSKPSSLAVNRDPRAARSHEALVGALLKLLEERPFERITIRDIVAEAGIGYTTFFRHHATKESLLDTIAAEQIRQLFELAFATQTAHDLHEGVVALFTYVHAHRPLWTALLTGGAAGTVREEFQRRAREVAAVWREPGSWLPADLGAQLIVGATLDLIAWWLRQAHPLPVKRVVELYEEVVLKPVLSAQPLKTSRKR